MHLAVVHLSPLISIPLATLTLGWMIWYWIHLGRPEAPSGRRKLRRVSLVLMFVLLPLLVAALSFLDPAHHQRQYIMAWMSAMLLVAILLIMAGLDALNTLRLVQQQTHEELREAAGELAEAIKARKQSLLAASPHRPAKNGDSHS
jgi:C4-dicarboxylate-specific signal transduction histidine kinase